MSLVTRVAHQGLHRQPGHDRLFGCLDASYAKNASHGLAQAGARLAATAAAVSEKMAASPGEGPLPSTYIAKLQSAGTNGKELRVRRLP